MSPARRPAGVLLAVALLAAACAGSGGSSGSSSSVSGNETPSLSTALISSPTSFVTLPTTGFWQLLARPAGQQRWELVTPPGVADNGGLVLSATRATGLLAAFRPSADLTSSPLSRITPRPGHWVAAGLLPGVADTPDALAAGPGGDLAAVVQGGRSLHLSAGASGTSTVPLSRLSEAAPACRVGLMVAVLWPTGASPTVGGRCAGTGVVPVWTIPGGAPRLAGSAPASLSGARLGVVRLAGRPGALLALLDVVRGSERSLVPATLAQGSGTWRAGAALGVAPTPAARPIVEPVPGGGWLYWSGTAGSPLELFDCVAASCAWHRFAAPPEHTVGLAPPGPRGEPVAFTNRSGSSLVEIFTTGPAGPWQVAQGLSVPIQTNG